MDGTILSQGSFIVPANGPINTYVQIPSAADWMKVYNYTEYGIANTETYNVGVEFYWQRGMNPGTGIVKAYAASGNNSILVGDIFPSGGFTIYDPSGLQAGSQPLLSAPVAFSAMTNADRPVLTTTNTAGVAVGTVIRVYGSAATSVNGIDMVVGAVTLNTSITLLTAANMLANPPGNVGGAGHYQIVYNPPLYYPARKTIVNISQNNGATVLTATEHSLTEGQVIRFNIPATSGMTQLNPTPQNGYLYATVTTVTGAYSFTIDTNTLSFNAFTWPTSTPNQEPTQAPSYEPIGENTAFANTAINSLAPLYQLNLVYNANNGVFADATVNTGYYGMILGTGATTPALAGVTTGPAGTAVADVMYWVAGKADFGGL